MLIFIFQVCFGKNLASCRTTSNLVANQAKQCAEPTAALGAPPGVDVEVGDDQVAAGGDAPVNNNGPDENVNTQATRAFKELAPTEKPPVKYTKKSRDRDEIQLKMLELLTTDPIPGPSNVNVKEDYLDMHFASIADCMRKRMTVDQQDDLLVEIDQLVNDAFHQLRRGTASAATRHEMADVTMGVQPLGNNQMRQQFPAADNPQSSNDMFSPQHPNQLQFQGFTNYMQLP